MDNRVWVWGLPIAPLTRSQAAEAVVKLVDAGQPSFFITANAQLAPAGGTVPGIPALPSIPPGLPPIAITAPVHR